MALYKTIRFEEVIEFGKDVGKHALIDIFLYLNEKQNRFAIAALFPFSRGLPSKQTIFI